MSQQVAVPGQGIIEFPDGMSDQDIETAIKKTFYPDATPSPTPESDKAAAEPLPAPAPQEPAEIGQSIAQQQIEQNAPTPEWLQNPAQAAGEVIGNFVKGQIPSSPTEYLKQVTYPAIYGSMEALKGLHGLYQQERAAEQTPAYSKERWEVGFNVMGQLAMAMAGKSLFKEGGKLNAERGSNAQIQARDTALGEQARPQGEVPGASGGDNVVGEAVGEKPVVEGAPSEAPQPVVTQPEGGGEPATAAAPESPPAAEPSLAPGAASREEYMRRYALLGASKLLEGHTELGAFSQQMVKEIGPQIADQLPEIFDRSKQMLNEMQTAGRSTSEIAQEIKRQTGITQPADQPVQVRPMTALKSIYQAAEKAGEAGYRRGVREGRVQTKAALGELKGQLDMADRWMAGDQEQVRQNMVDFVNAVLPPAERGRFINRITQALRRPSIARGAPDVMYRRAFDVMQDISDRAQDVWKRDLRSEISGLHDDIVNSPGIAPEIKEGTRDLFKDVSLEKKITPSSAGRLERLQAALQAKGKNIPGYLQDQLRNFYGTPLEEMSLEQLESLRDQAYLNKKLGYQIASDRKAGLEAEYQERATDLANSPTAPVQGFDRTVIDYSASGWAKVRNNLMNRVKDALNWASVHEKARLFIPRLFETLDGSPNGWLYKNVYEPFVLGHRNYLNDFNPVKERAVEIAERNNLGEDDFRRIGVHAHGMQLGTREELLRYAGDKTKMSALIDDVEKNGLTKGQQELYDYFRSVMDKNLPEMKQFFADFYNKELTTYDNYFPRQLDPAKAQAWYAEREKWEHPVTGKVIEPDEVAKELHSSLDRSPRTRQVAKGFATARVPEAQIPINLNSMEVFLKHAEDWAYVKNMQPHLNMVGKLANTNLFAAKYGKIGKGMVLDYIDALARRGRYSRQPYERAMDYLRNRAMVGTLGFRLNQFKHLANYPLGMHEAGGGMWWERGLTASMTEEGQAFLKQYAPEMQRAAAGDISIREASDIGKTGKASFYIDRVLDFRNRAATFLGRYMSELDKKGLSWTDFHQLPPDNASLATARRAYVNAVGSPSVVERPLILTKGTSIGSASLGKTIMAYQSPKMVRWGTVRSALVEDGWRQGNYGKAAAKLGYAGVGSLMESAVKFGSREAYRAAAAGILSVLGFSAYRRQHEPSTAKQVLTEAAVDLASIAPGGSSIGKAAAVAEYPQAKREILSQTTIPTFDTLISTYTDVGLAMSDPLSLKNNMQLAGDLLQLGGVPVSTAGAIGREMVKQSDWKGQQRADRAEMIREGLIPKGRIKTGPTTGASTGQKRSKTGATVGGGF